MSVYQTLRRLPLQHFCRIPNSHSDLVNQGAIHCNNIAPKIYTMETDTSCGGPSGRYHIRVGLTEAHEIVAELGEGPRT